MTHILEEGCWMLSQLSETFCIFNLKGKRKRPAEQGDDDGGGHSSHWPRSPSSVQLPCACSDPFLSSTMRCQSRRRAWVTLPEVQQGETGQWRSELGELVPGGLQSKTPLVPPQMTRRVCTRTSTPGGHPWFGSTLLSPSGYTQQPTLTKQLPFVTL